MKKLDLTNQKIAHFNIVDFAHQLGRKRFWNCICECGTKLIVNQENLKSGHIKSCGCKRKGNTHASWTGFEEISGQYWSSIKCGANKRKIEFTISIEYIWNLFIKQDGKCAISGKKLYLCVATIDKNLSIHNASLDRIDSSKGYIEGNVQWVDKDVNRMKTDFNELYFIDTCKLIAEYNKDK